MIPVIIEGNGTTSKPFRKYNKSIIGKQEINELQKTVILGYAHILEAVLLQNYKRFIVGKRIISPTECNSGTNKKFPI
jgi:hypothetical protein